MRGKPFEAGFRATAIFLTVALLPVQFVAIGVGTTKIDLSNIVFLLLAASILPLGLRKPISRRYYLFLTVFALIQLALFIAGATPMARFISAFGSVFPILLVYGWRRYVVLNARLCYFTVLAGTGLLAAVILFQLRVLGIERPAGTMAEPSPAGLIMVATAAGLLISLRWSQIRLERTVFTVAAGGLVYVSYLVRTTHLISFCVALSVAAAFSRRLNVRTLIIGGVLLTGVYYVASADTHYVSRVDFANPAANLSLLSWLQGFDQMIASLRQSPLTGRGLGATGTFEFYSKYSSLLAANGIPDLNRFDAYSGFFRLMIETGPVFMGALAYAIWLRLRELWRGSKYGLLPRTRDSQYQVFLFTFALTLIVGFLLKEPVYTRSQVVVGALLFCIVPLRVKQGPTFPRAAAALRNVAAASA